MSILPSTVKNRGNIPVLINTGKELDEETGLYYYGARYLDPRTSRWLSADPAMGEYIPVAPVNDEARRRNGNLPGMGGIFNYVNLHVYHYAGNNPVKYLDPDGREQNDVQKKYTQLLANIGAKKDDFNILILRSKDDNGHNGTYFRSELSIMHKRTILFSANVQSTADHSKLNQDADHEGRTIPFGNYTGTFLEKSGTYLNAIRITGNGVEAGEWILIHPNVVTNPGSERYPAGPFVPPGSLGCQMLTEGDFNEMVDILNKVGFRINDTIKIQITTKGYEP
jgi:RHS repeat-associated protein